MYPVSDEYIAARRAPVKEERITGGIKLKDGTIIEVNDSVIIQGSLSISRDVCGSKWDIGTMNYSKMQLRIRDESAYDHEFGGALIKLTYGIVTAVAEDGAKTWENVPLPPYYVDGSQTTRKRNMVKLTAYDPITLLDINYPDTIPTTSLYAALMYVCNRAGIGLATTEEEFNALPNSDVIPDFSSESVKTCRDAAMWIAQTVNCSGFCDYRGLLKLKQFKYEGGNNYDRLFTASERSTIEYSDTKTYLAYLQSYSGSDVKLYSRVTTWTGTDAPHIKEGAADLPKNPILQKLTPEQHDAVNTNYLSNRSFPTRYIKATAFVDPALEPLDVAAFTGGNIDVGQIINVVTQIKWKYRGTGTICCNNIAEHAETASAASNYSVDSELNSAALDTASTGDDEEIVRLAPKSQIEKRLDAVEAEMGASSGVGMKSPLDPTSEIFNCYDGRNVAGVSGSSNYASVIGVSNEATGFCSFACGYGCKATGYECFCGGYESEAKGTGDIVYGNQCVASGYDVAVFGDNCKATYADHSLVGGSNSSVSRVGTFLHGYYCSAENAAWTTVLGENCASKYGEASLVSGDHLIGSDVNGSAVFGVYNDNSLYNVIFAVGNGNSGTRSNALTLDINGNLTISGKLICADVASAANETSAVSLLSGDSEEITYTAQSDNVVEFGGITYTFTAAETGEYTGVTTSTGKSMTANIPEGLSNTQTHNAAFMAIAITSLK